MTEKPAPAHEPPSARWTWVRTRKVRRGAHKLILVGARGGGMNDLYHGMLDIPLWGLTATLVAVYIALNLAFAGLYLLDPRGVTNLRPGDFWAAFFFSVQTLSTVGYGTLAPVSLYANLVVTVECFLNLVMLAVTTGVIFARVSKPTARVLFSKVATITRFEGRSYLMLRAINERSNQILEAEVMLSLARRTVTKEGKSWRRVQPLAVTRQRTPLFALGWTIMHPLDEASPLYGATAESLIAEEAEIIVVISGVDDTLSQRIHARHIYEAEDILWNKAFESVLDTRDDGLWIVDYRKFHDVRDDRE